MENQDMSSKNYVRLVVLVLAFFAGTTHSIGQSCKYQDSSMFVINIRSLSDSLPLDRAKFGVRVVDGVDTGYGEGCFATTLPWMFRKMRYLNVERSFKQRKGAKADFPILLEYFTCTFYNKWENYHHKPIFYVWIWDSVSNETKYYRLDYGESINICQNYVSLRRKSKSSQIVMENGKPFKPIDIVFGSMPDDPPVAYPLKELYFQSINSYNRERQCRAIDSVLIVDYQTNNVVQVINPNEQQFDTTLGLIWHHDILGEVDVFGDNPKGIY